MKKIYSYLFCIALCCFGARAYAQHEIFGKVSNAKDSTGISDVYIYLADLKTGTVTDADGQYVIKNIPAGIYQIEVKHIGYASQIMEVNASETPTLNVVLHESTQHINEVIVTGVSSAATTQNTPISVNVLTDMDFKQSSATNIIDAIANSPGVSQITDGPAISKPVIRGLSYNRVVVVNDGVRQEGQQWGDEFGIEVDEYSVNRVEVYKGPASLRYGSDAMAGVINMLAAPTLKEGQIKANVLANYQSNNGLFGESFNLAGNIKGFVWDVRYSNKTAHSYKNKYDGYVWNSAYAESNGKGMVGINRKWGYSHLTMSVFDLKLGITEGTRDSTTGKFTKHVLASDGSDSMAIASDKELKDYNNFPIIHQHVRHYKAVLDNQFAIGKGLLGVRIGYQENFRQEANDITRGDTYNNSFFLRTINYDVRYAISNKNNFEFSVGVNGMKQSSENRGIVYLIPAYNLFDFGVFSIAKKTIGRLSISGGLRYDNRQLMAKDLYTDSSGVKVDNPDGNSVHRFTAYNSNFAGVSASLGATYDFTKKIYGKINVSRGYRAPNIAESGSNGIHDGTPFYEIGDVKLKPESSLQFDATLGVNTENYSAEVNAFVNQINNYIFAVKLGSTSGGDSIRTDVVAGMSGPTFKYVSGDAVLSGGEAVLDIHPSVLKGLHFKNSFSMVNAIQKNQGDSTKYLPYTPPLKFQSELKYIFPKVSNLLKNVYLKVGIDHYFEQNKIYYKFDNETVTPAYTLVNAGVGADITNNDHTLFSLYIYCSNLTDEAYQSNMSRLKYGGTNNTTGRTGVYNMGRNISFKVVIPIDIKK
ncbi:MAG: TonB-dependent receptor plug [Chitinophagaceae bacterium]|nr:TonB-dependent receptor plug [Chitinophagaceae bacterium]